MQCINYESVKSHSSVDQRFDRAYLKEEADMTTVFNFAKGREGSMIDGYKYVSPKHLIIEDPLDENLLHSCANATRNMNAESKCTHIVDLPHGKIIDLVFTNIQSDDTEQEHTGHPVHIHGHSFSILYMGNPSYDSTKGYKNAEGMSCKSYDCDYAVYNPTDSIKAKFNMENPPLKDTLQIAPMHYAVVRIKTDNPGYWFFHCHTERHFTRGMGMILNVGKGHHVPLPDNFEHCGPIKAPAKPVEKECKGKGGSSSGVVAKAQQWVLLVVMGVLMVYL